MDIKKFKIRWIVYPNTSPKDGYLAIKINGAVYRSDDKEILKKVEREMVAYLEKERNEMS